MIIVLILIVATFLFWVVNQFNRAYILSLFQEGNTLTCGLRGRGKDLLFSFVTNYGKRYKKGYISNVKYNDKCIKANMHELLSCNNTFYNFTNNKINYYEWKYPENTDIFISDAGVYYPNFEHNILDKTYPSAPMFFCLSRHIGNVNVHCNIQNIEKLWDKPRVLCDTYILCRKARVLFGKFAKIKLTIYDNFDSCVSRREPFLAFGLGKEYRMRKVEYQARYGNIKNITIRFILKNKYDSRAFKEILKNGKK